MKKLALLLLLITITFSCTQHTGNNASHQVPYTEAQRYFIKNTINTDVVTFKKLTSQEEFDEVCGAATVMGPNGSPTKIDFTKSYAIALYGPLTNKNPSLTITSLIKDDGNIVLSYTLKEGETLSYTTRAAKVLIVSKQYAGNISLNKL